MRLKLLLAGLALLLLSPTAAYEEELRLAFVGDLDPWMMRAAGARARARLAAATADCQVVFGNLECALTEQRVPLRSKTGATVLAGATQTAPKARDYLLKAPPSLAPLLRETGFTVVSLANNHTMDYGASGLLDTLAALKAADLGYCGAGADLGQARAPFYVSLPQARVGLVAYSEIAPLGSKATLHSPGIAWFAYPPGASDRERILGSVRQARSAGADLVVVSLHWGKESSTEVEPYQRTFARQLLAGGADCVIGHHPHVLRSVEDYGGKTIAYSLGNYLFSRGTSRTVLLKMTFGRDEQGRWRQRALPQYLKVREGLPQIP